MDYFYEKLLYRYLDKHQTKDDRLLYLSSEFYTSFVRELYNGYFHTGHVYAIATKFGNLPVVVHHEQLNPFKLIPGSSNG